MFRYVLAILLVTCYNSLGNPVRITSKQISASIVALENNCGNVFLKSLLNSKVNDCTDGAPPYKIKQLQCLMFYDMGTQLCTAVSTSGLTLNEDYTSKINEEADVNNLCETTKDWIFTDHLDYHSYKNIIEKNMKHPVTCGQICGSDELISDDANFYCKFYKWGWEVIKNHISTISQGSTNLGVVAQSQPNSAIDTNKLVDSTHDIKEPLDISIKSTTSNDKPKETEPSSGPLEKVNDANNPYTKQTAPEVAITNKEANHQIATNTKKSDGTQANVIKPEEPSMVEQDIVIPSIEKVIQEVDNKNESVIPLSDTGKKEFKIESEQKESVLENPKDKVLLESDHFVDDDLNSEDEKEGNDDLQDEDDGGDPMISDNIKPAVKKTESDNKVESVVSSFNKEISQREFYSGNAQDVGADDADDDDHFFTFFLTAVVLVVLLYILYHDKSKISKLFFGLLVEGRQNGRRRNSRGHSYRRLDTLEQAMSTNTTAPPSKLIY